MGGCNVNEALALKEGFEHDRMWMLVNESGKFLTQRSLPKLALFKLSIKDSYLSVTFDSKDISIPFGLSNSKVRKVSVFESYFKAMEVDEGISQWFSEILNKKVTLVRKTKEFVRYKAFLKPPFKTKVSMADGYPYLILGTASMNLLNSKLETPILSNRFRPNIIVKTEEAHIEDEWKYVSTSEASFKNIKPCARCVLITVEQETGDKGKEPLKTLSTYRKKNNKILFGSNMILSTEGMVRVGEVLSIKK